MTTKRYAIVNDADRPHRRMVTELIDGRLYYMAGHEEPHLKNYALSPEHHNPTFLEDYGFEITESIFGTVGFYLPPNAICTATYRDGRPREWQGEQKFHHQRVDWAPKY